MLRRQTRLRREFLYTKGLEQKERQIWERKQRVKDLLAKGKSVPNGHGVGDREGRMDDGGAAPLTHIDDEYSQAGIEDPRVLITTSRDPSSKLAQFSKEMRLCIPNSTRINRGNYVMKELADACRTNGITDLIVLHEHRGVPDALMLSHFPHGPTVLFTLSGVVLRHSLAGVQGATVSEQFPHLIFEGFGSSLGRRVSDALKFIYPVPKEDSKRTMTFVNEGDFISFREVQLAEVGPRFEMRRSSLHSSYEIRQGTIEQTEADVEPHSGSCLCGNTKVEVASSHSDGQITNILAQQNDVKITGSVKEYNSKASSGNTVTRVFCGDCGAALAHKSKAFGDAMAVQTGALQGDFSKIPFVAELFTKDRWTGLAPIKGADQKEVM
ncbi:hypothetical protein RQP46_009342 [Phenoliferia psychrophenolica]